MKSEAILSDNVKDGKFHTVKNIDLCNKVQNKVNMKLNNLKL